MESAEAIKALNNSLSFWECVEFSSAAAVTVGVAGEVIHEFFPWFKSFEWWKSKGNRASALLLVFSLAIELVALIQVTSISGRIIATLERETAAANKRVAEIEKVTAWRPVSLETAQKLSSALAAIPATVPHKIVFAYAQNDEEALYFTFQIGRVFLALKDWDANIYSETHPGIFSWGVRILGPDNETTRAVRKAFVEAGISFAIEPIPGPFQSYGYTPKPEDTVISVGPRKPPLEP